FLQNVLVYQTVLADTDIPVYLLENPTYLSRGPVYSAKSAEGSPLDIDRFSFFSKAVTEFLLKPETSNLQPDVVHCHDWHTAWIPLLQKTENRKQKTEGIRTLLTIHNMGRAYQGRTGNKIIEKLGIYSSSVAGSQYDSSRPSVSNNNEVNILLQGIVNADLITTVSPTYAKEIQTEEYGEGLHNVLQKYNSKLSGILNGVDYEVWNPETDKDLTTNYSSNEVPLSGTSEKSKNNSSRPSSSNNKLLDWQEGKKRNKTKLLETVGLPRGENIPTFGMVSRIANQKGFDILLPALEKLLSAYDARVIILGLGDPDLKERIEKLESRYKGKLKFIGRFDDLLAHLIYSGSDFFLVPSRFEPCGLTQLIAMRYGGIPVVRKTGGLADSVDDGVTGFVFEEYSGQALFKKLEESYKIYNDYNIYKKMVNSALQKNFSWEESAKKYLELYKKLNSNI
ncbi:MAG: glycogen synthase, partial [Patescibacteria group bacterium]|nr:glycogen synthase [Patescibacteria group bacterium]